MSQKAPSYSGLKPASESASRIKQNNRNKDTVHELMLRSVLWRMGLRFRKNVSSLPGKPDIVFPKSRVVVFCDGDFWHGRNWHSLKNKLEQGTNPKYWIAKIQTNIDRDKRTVKTLEKQGWYVIRVWENDIKSDVIGIAESIRDVVKNR